ncbi:hypothetical protein ABZX12_20930 [Kribbella sp. NPDC003505]|uniref:hypothetical protein n=1 Tax=Kribbella sp. NPDC003505 TaxID=3154448 RepID=UPI0033AA0729
MQRSTLLSGALLAVVAGLLCLVGEALGLNTQHVALVGGALGGVVGLVQDRTPAMRATGFLIGLFIAWLGFAVRALYLPDSASGRAVAAVAVVAVCVAFTAGSGEKIPLWTLLLGAAAMVAVYEETYTADSPAFLAQSPSAATGVLLAAGIGFLATSLRRPQPAPPAERSEVPPDEPAEEDAWVPADDTREFASTEGDRA